jgi:hypothetical protein
MWPRCGVSGPPFVKKVIKISDSLSNLAMEELSVSQQDVVPFM